MIVNLSRNTLLVELVLLKTTGIGQPRRVEDANLGRGYSYSRNTLTLTTMPFLLLTSWRWFDSDY